MTTRYRGGTIPEPGPIGDLEKDLQRVAAEARQRAEKELEAWEIGNALHSTWNFVRRTCKSFNSMRYFFDNYLTYILVCLPQVEVFESACEALFIVA